MGNKVLEMLARQRVHFIAVEENSTVMANVVQ